MKRILVTQRLVRDGKTGEERDCLDVRWGPLLEAAGMLPVPFPSGYPAEAFLAGVPCDGLLLTGGNDLAAVSRDPLSARRDAVEKRLLALFVARGLPVLGVCRGMQLVGEAYGMRISRVEGHVGTRQAIAAAPGSRYAALLEAVGEVNSYHGYAVAEVRPPFAVSAVGADGVIEAMEWGEKGVFCQMWHSEREEPVPEAQVALLRAVFGNRDGSRDD